MSESVLQKQIISEAKKRGMLALKVEAVGRRGLPDLLVISNGQTTYIEVKNPNGKGKLSELQKLMIADMKDHGAEVFVTDDIAEAIDILEKML